MVLYEQSTAQHFVTIILHAITFCHTFVSYLNNIVY